MNAQTKRLVKNGAMALVAGSAIVLSVIWMLNAGNRGGERGQVWFYDLSEKRLYAGSRNTLPPDRGIGGPAGDGVRAVVVGFTIGEKDRNKLRVAYLETYTPGLKGILESILAARTGGKTYDGQLISRTDAFFQRNDLVKRETDNDWQPSGSEQGKIIMNAWRSWRGPNGESPVVCVP
jgi:hypothetical protein